MKTVTKSIKCDYCDKRIEVTVTASNRKANQEAHTALRAKAIQEGWIFFKVAFCPDHRKTGGWE